MPVVAMEIDDTSQHEVDDSSDDIVIIETTNKSTMPTNSAHQTHGSAVGKRVATDTDAPNLSTKKPRQSNGATNTWYCHQDHQPYDHTKVAMLKCTHTSFNTSNTAKTTSKKCGATYCGRCLQGRYSESVSDVDASTWKCPKCRGICNCSVCRRKSNLDPIGALNRRNIDGANGAQTSNFKAASLKVGGDAGNEYGQSVNGKSGPVRRSPPRSAAGGTALHPKMLSKEEQRPNGNDSESSLSVLSDSEGEHKAPVAGRVATLPKARSTNGPTQGDTVAATGVKVAPTKPKPAAPAKSRKGPSDVPPKAVSPPPTYPFSHTWATPPTSSLLARLHVRSFVLRFLDLMPSLQAETNKMRQIILALSDDPIWFWSQNAEIAQRHLLRGLLEVLEGEEEEDIMDDPGSWKLMRRLVLKEVEKSISNSDRNRVLAPWRTLREIVEIEEIWMDWEDKLEEWRTHRQEHDGPDQGMKTQEIDVDEKLALTCALIDLLYNAECVRQALSEGLDTERHTIAQANKNKLELRRKWTETKQGISARRPAKPQVAADGKLLKDLKAEWDEQVKELDEELEVEEQNYYDAVDAVDRKVYLATAGSSIRFAPAGVDVHGNEYYLPSPCTLATYPIEDSIASGDEYAHLSWTILVHGRPFTKGESSKKVPGKIDKRSSRGDEDDDDDYSDSDSVDQDEIERAEKGDAWFRIDPVEDGEKLCDWIEYGVLQAEYDAMVPALNAPDQSKARTTTCAASDPLDVNGMASTRGKSTAASTAVAAKPEQTPSVPRTLPETYQRLDVQPLVRSIIAFTEYVISERDLASGEGEKKKKDKRKKGKRSL